MIWLGIDTANTPLSVAIVKDGQLLAEENAAMAINHSLRAMPAIEELFNKVDMSPADVDAIAVSEGPGSYTGVRIGVTIAKTLAWTLQKPLYGLSSLQVLAGNAIYFNGLICPIMDARRGNVYSAAYRYQDGLLTAVIEEGHYALEELIRLLEQDEPILFIGKDTAIHEKQLVGQLGDRAVIAPLHLNLPRASSLIHLVQQKQESDIHTFVPEYRRLAEAEANWLKEQGKEQVRDSND
ncbi:tRNA (adenosine(37)-N6)-threonylcarbamoyltransferase complex dimerization subunit type 1 TsaB [Sporosarcina sp. ACRSM]|uniref:tRNA (adenosine(37)-N6)-threonylcarbamoyltransferase complex dimerization subunit type 1 TsaB n=1 Tax=Sporosarcina sp. ACRSM TaxID=2918216 RepID=UPI001EF6780D|nr:tRNA (adenosine(37)-N6)-threonylcarbamoyltransferase complex dimerization subunit type 1 TsaB [Sporosarcina sp. ACRSM]MCG7337180.1 tRNA (adenosine(37)-N6)-threonylcarbamoyltransferase complex dimerization subunit type 1 TsaB [Sporosarcina sp. ACRSM]